MWFSSIPRVGNRDSSFVFLLNKTGFQDCDGSEPLVQSADRRPAEHQRRIPQTHAPANGPFPASSGQVQNAFVHDVEPKRLSVKLVRNFLGDCILLGLDIRVRYFSLAAQPSRQNSLDLVPIDRAENYDSEQGE